MNFYFLRHFLTEIDPKIPVSDWKLSEKGKDEQELLIQSLEALSLQKIYTSPEKKALMTAEIIASNYDIPIIKLDSLKEVNRDKMGFIIIDYKIIVKNYFQDEMLEEINWELKKNVQKRINSFKSILRNEESTILIIGHGLFFTLLLAPIFNKNYFEFWSNLKFGEIIRISDDQIF